jgi:hypothetical protein
MSNLTQINEYLEQTRNLSVEELNTLIFKMDNTAVSQVSQGLAHSILGYMKLIELNDGVATFAAGQEKAAKLQERHGWMYAAPVVVEEKPVVEVVQAVKVPKAKTETKTEIAARIYAGLADKSKAHVMEVFQRELQTTVQGSQSYYYAVGGEKSGKRGRKPSASAAPKAVYVRKTPVGVPTKRELATKLFTSAPDKSRAVIIDRFQKELGLTAAGSVTYFYNVGGAHIRAAKK